MKDGKKVAIGLVAAVGGILLLVAWKKPSGPPPPPPPDKVTLYGLVIDAVTGEPIKGASIIVYQDYGSHTDSYPRTTNSYGYYEIRNMLIDVDLTQMVIYADGYQTYTNEDVSIVEGLNELNIQMVPV